MAQRGGNTIPELVQGYDDRLKEMANNVTTIKQQFETCKKFQGEMKDNLIVIHKSLHDYINSKDTQQQQAKSARVEAAAAATAAATAKAAEETHAAKMRSLAEKHERRRYV